MFLVLLTAEQPSKERPLTAQSQKRSRRWDLPERQTIKQGRELQGFRNSVSDEGFCQDKAGIQPVSVSGLDAKILLQKY
jgi:hypothetical protein